jgi:cytosine/adenosine deaminase-related metal-dependent hydrolase
MIHRRLVFVLALSLGSFGCGGDDLPPTDAGPDASPDTGMGDAGMDGSADAGADADVDGGMDAGMDSGADAGPLPDGGTVASPAPEVLRMGTGGFLLRGVVLAPGAVLDPGEVLVVGDTITCVAADCSGEPSADTVTLIDTHGTISPGLIDAHNHLTYDFLPEWVPDPLQIFNDRYAWANDPDYEAHIAPFGDGRSRGDHICPGAKWGELRALMHGTTTVEGQSRNLSCLNRLVRNADHHHGLGRDSMQTNIGSVRDITDATATGLLDNYIDATPTTRYVVHMAEGISDNTRLEFASLAGRDPRSNRHMGLSLLAGNYMGVDYAGEAVLIHSVPLTDAEMMEAADTQSKIVWSPSSNIVLYGATAPIGRMIELGLTIGIGPDWTVSGEDDLLAEMRFALDWAATEGEAAITPQRLWEMATFDGADVVGLDIFIGGLEVGKRADISVFGRRGMDAYQAVTDSRAEDVRLVLIDGQGYYGDTALEMATSVNAECEMFDACGAPKFVCLANTPGATTSTARAGETVADVESQLTAILDGYGRGSELLPLVACE